MINPMNYMKNPKLVRMKYLEGAVRRAAVWATFLGIGSLLGAETELNPLSSDFGKARIGNTRMDSGTGLLQWIVLTARHATGLSKSSTSNRTTELGSSAIARTREDITYEFMKNKLHPALSPGLAAYGASKNNPMYLGSEALESVSPFPVSDLIDLMKSDPEIEQIIMGMISTSASMGSQTYSPREFGKPQFDIPGDVKFEGGKIIK
jgi:hypothetical protein